jgi:hypothetical protein
MDSKSQTSADGITTNEFGHSCSCSTTLSDTTFGVSSGCCANEMVEKLLVQLKEKDEQLEKNKEGIQVFEFPYILIDKLG